MPGGRHHSPGHSGGPELQSLLIMKRLPWWFAMQKARVRSLGQEDSLEKGMATHSSTLAWRTPWTEEPGAWQAMVHGLAKSWTRLSD